jgi:hypothetical protein
VTTFDPDGDGFDFQYEKAFALHKNMNMLQFIRKTLLANKCKKLKQDLNHLEAQFNKEKETQKLPESWSVAKHDKALL